MPAGMLAQDQLGSRSSDGFRGHDLVAKRIAHHSMLMYAGLVGEGVASDDGFIGLCLKADHFAERLTCRIEILTENVCLVWHLICTNTKRHDDFFQRRIAGTLANAVDGAFD